MQIRPGYRPIMAALTLIGGCATITDPTEPRMTTIPEQASNNDAQVFLRQSRYTLIELRPELQQQNLQQQIIDLRIPATPDTTVGDALRYVLRRSGYRLCAGEPTLSTLLALPLPAAHLRLGPLELRQALQLLVGKGWTLAVDEPTRQVCFVSVPDQPASLEVQP